MSKPSVNGILSLPDFTSIEQELLSIPGVRGARVVVDGHGGIKEIHAVAAARRSPKKIVRNIESFLVVRYGYRIDYRKISLVQMAEHGPVERLSLGRVEQIAQPEGTYVVVELYAGDQTYEGRVVLGDDLARAAAQATIAALNARFATHAPLDLSGLQQTTVGERQVVIVCVTYWATVLEDMLGTAFIRSCVAESAARAVLAATNRRLAGWLHNRQHAAATAVAVA